MRNMSSVRVMQACAFSKLFALVACQCSTSTTVLVNQLLGRLAIGASKVDPFRSTLALLVCLVLFGCLCSYLSFQHTIALYNSDRN